jgi:hypothetical protein
LIDRMQTLKPLSFHWPGHQYSWLRFTSLQQLLLSWLIKMVVRKDSKNAYSWLYFRNLDFWPSAGLATWILLLLPLSSLVSHNKIIAFSTMQTHNTIYLVADLLEVG